MHLVGLTEKGTFEQRQVGGRKVSSVEQGFLAEKLEVGAYMRQWRRVARPGWLGGEGLRITDEFGEIMELCGRE